ncbi:hypothetical protein M0R45_008935 [Rubus argutus]|uniref:Uncharacterized protein n=1 Tax=Rubus argutus TaxID=59490 RepID=A0AAW1Y3H1_RUBAR
MTTSWIAAMAGATEEEELGSPTWKAAMEAYGYGLGCILGGSHDGLRRWVDAVRAEGGRDLVCWARRTAVLGTELVDAVRWRRTVWLLERNCRFEMGL